MQGRPARKLGEKKPQSPEATERDEEKATSGTEIPTELSKQIPEFGENEGSAQITIFADGSSSHLKKRGGAAALTVVEHASGGIRIYVTYATALGEDSTSTKMEHKGPDIALDALLIGGAPPGSRTMIVNDHFTTRRIVREGHGFMDPESSDMEEAKSLRGKVLRAERQGLFVRTRPPTAEEKSRGMFKRVHDFSRDSSKRASYEGGR